MRVSKAIVEESVNRVQKIAQLESIYEEMDKMFKEIAEENPYVAHFIGLALKSWEKRSPQSLREQLTLLGFHLMTLVDMYRRQEEVDKLEEQLGK